MTAQDYYAWADEYRTQYDVLDKLLATRNTKRFTTHKERYVYEHTTAVYREMRRDCSESYYRLMEIAKEIEKNERT